MKIVHDYLTPFEGKSFAESPKFLLSRSIRAAPCKSEFFNNSPVNQMFLYDSLNHFRRAGMIPDAFGINHGDRPLRADAQAIRFGAINQRLRLGKIQFFEPPLQVIPRFKPLLFRRALRLSLVRTKKNVPPIFFQAVSLGGLLQFRRCAHGLRLRVR